MCMCDAFAWLYLTGKRDLGVRSGQEGADEQTGCCDCRVWYGGLAVIVSLGEQCCVCSGLAEEKLVAQEY